MSNITYIVMNQTSCVPLKALTSGAHSCKESECLTLIGL